MTRFVEVWTLKRGVIETPEPLADPGQRAALMRLIADEPKYFDAHATALGVRDPQRVVWSAAELANFAKYGVMRDRKVKVA